MSIVNSSTVNLIKANNSSQLSIYVDSDDLTQPETYITNCNNSSEQANLLLEASSILNDSLPLPEQVLSPPPITIAVTLAATAIDNEEKQATETFNDAEDVFKRTHSGENTYNEDDPEQSNDHNRLLIKSISSHQLNEPVNLKANNIVNIKQISVSRCFLNMSSNENENEECFIVSSSSQKQHWYDNSKTSTAKTSSTTTAIHNSIYLNDLKHKHRLLGSYCALTRSRSSSASSISSSCSSASPSNASASSLFGTNFNSNYHYQIKQQQNRKNRVKKMKLSTNLNGSSTQQPQQQQATKTTLPVGNLSQQATKSGQISVSGVAKKMARYNRFSKFRKTLNKTNEETRLTKKYASSSFSIGTADSANNGGIDGGYSFKKLKCLLVGDPCVGKSTLMCLFLKRIFQTEYQPTIVDDFEVKVNLNGENYTLNLFDTAGQEDWETLRVMAYPDSDVIILCFSVVRPDSMENILNKWIIELNRYIPNVLIVLVGTQVDLRDPAFLSLTVDDPNYKQRHISSKEGEELKQRIKAYKYIECSALTQLNVKEVFDSCIDAYNSRIKKVQPSSCFQLLFRTFTNSLRRLRFPKRDRSSTASGNDSITSSNGNKSKLQKFGKTNPRKYMHES